MHFPYRFSENAGSGSASFGYDGSPTTLMVILNRWHSMTRHGTTLITILVGRLAENLDAVDDGFGNLVVLDRYDQFHRTSPRDD